MHERCNLCGVQNKFKDPKYLAEWKSITCIRPQNRIKLDPEIQEENFIGARHATTDIEIVDQLSEETPKETCGINNCEEKLPDGKKHQFHIEKEHAKRCVYCEKISYSEDILKTHMKLEYEKQYYTRFCKVCKSPFDNSCKNTIT